MNDLKRINSSDIMVVVDVEATCSNDGTISRNEMEIIEIGAVKITKKGNIISKFDAFIKPSKHPKLTEFCKKLTGITQDQIDNAAPFPHAFKNFMDFFKDSDLLLSWGIFDYQIILKECDRFKVELKKLKLPPEQIFSIPHVNLKEVVKKIVPNKFSGFKGVMKYYGLKFEGSKHRGIDDAFNIARVYQKMYKRIKTKF